MDTPEQVAALEGSRPSGPSRGRRTPLPHGGPESLSDKLTFVLDFKEAAQGETEDVSGNIVADFDLAPFGFTGDKHATVVNAIVDKVRRDYYDELAGTVAGPPGQRLAVDFIVGDIGTPPPGRSNYYYIQLGEPVNIQSFGYLGDSWFSSVRDENGMGPALDLGVGDIVGSVFTDAFPVLIDKIVPADALTSGNLEFTSNAISRVISHEIGHTISLSHIKYSDSVQVIPGTPPLMGTGERSSGMPNQAYIMESSFSLSGFDPVNGTPLAQVRQLRNAIGLETTTAADISISGRVTTADGRGITNATITVNGASLASPIVALTGRRGNYIINGLKPGEAYIITVTSRRYAFSEPSQVVAAFDNITDLNFVGHIP